MMREDCEINHFKRLMLSTIARDPAYNFSPRKGMDIENLFNWAWGTSHQFAWTEATLRRCTDCTDYGIENVNDSTMNKEERLLYDLHTAEQRLQKRFDRLSNSKDPTCRCFKGQTVRHLIVLDRMPAMLL